MNLTIAITVFDGYQQRLIGPSGGCPLLYVRDEDNDDKKQGLKTEEFFGWLTKNGCFEMPETYVKVKFLLSWFAIDNGQEITESEVCTLQDIYPLCISEEELMKTEDDVRDPRMSIIWNVLRNCFKHIYKASFGVDDDTLNWDGSILDSDDRQKLIYIYEKVKAKFGEKLSKETFIQSINGRLQKRELYELTEQNIEAIVNAVRMVLANVN